MTGVSVDARESIWPIASIKARESPWMMALGIAHKTRSPAMPQFAISTILAMTGFFWSLFHVRLQPPPPCWDPLERSVGALSPRESPLRSIDREPASVAEARIRWGRSPNGRPVQEVAAGGPMACPHRRAARRINKGAMRTLFSRRAGGVLPFFMGYSASSCRLEAGTSRDHSSLRRLILRVPFAPKTFPHTLSFTFAAFLANDMSLVWVKRNWGRSSGANQHAL